jgi:uncharacterized protein YutE (UPF0331/DUF86 family)
MRGNEISVLTDMIKRTLKWQVPDGSTFVKERGTITPQPDARTKRYMLKIEHARGRSALVHDWLKEKGLENDLRTMLAIHKAFQEIVEVIMDLIAMMLKDTSTPPLDDYTNISKAVVHGLLPQESESVLREANGLRNRLIHVYNDINGGKAVGSIQKLLPKLDEYLRVIDKWIKQTKPR